MRFRPALLAGGLAALVVPAAVVPAAAASTPTRTLRSVAPADLAPWDPATTATPPTRWFVLPGDQAGQGSYSFVPPAGLGQPGGLRLSAPAAGDRITVMTTAPAGTTVSNLSFHYELQGTPTGPLVPLADLDCNGSSPGGDVRATPVDIYLSPLDDVVPDRDIRADGTTGSGSGAVAFPAGQPVELSKLATVCPTVVRVGLRAQNGTVTTVSTVDTGSTFVPTTPGQEVLDIFRASPPGSQPALRLGGRDRIATALAVAAQVTSGTAGRAVLAGSAGFPDSVVGSALALEQHAPLLLTPPGGLDARVASFLTQHLTSGGQVIILGGTGALSATVEKQVKSLGFTTVRYGGSDRFATALTVASHMRSSLCGQTEYPQFDDIACGATLVDGSAFADAISGSRLGQPVLYTLNGKVPAAVSAYVAKVAPTAFYGTAFFAVGGSAAAAASTLPTSSRFKRLAGADRYATSALALAQNGYEPRLVALASGENFPDALAGSTLAPVLLTRPTSLPATSAQALTTRAPLVDTLIALGTSDVTSDSTVAAAQRALAAGA